MGVGLASFFSRASQHVGQALQTKHAQNQQALQQEINVLQSIFASPQSSAEQQALAVIGLDELNKKGKPGAGLGLFSKFATDSQLQARVDELVKAGQGLAQQGTPGGVAAAAGVGGAAAGGPPAPGGLPGAEPPIGGPAIGGGATPAEVAPPGLAPPGASSMTPGALPPGIGPAVLMGEPGTPPVSGGPPAPGMPGSPPESELLPGGQGGQLATPAMAGAASQPINRAGEQSDIQPLPMPMGAQLQPAAAAEGPPLPGVADPTAAAPAGGQPQPQGPAATPSQQAFAAQAQELEQQAIQVDIELQTVRRQIFGVLEQLQTLAERRGIFNPSADVQQKRQHATEMLKILKQTEEQLNTRRDKILERHSMVMRTAATQLAQHERTTVQERGRNQRSNQQAGARIQAAQVGANTRAEADEQRASRRALADLNNFRQRKRTDIQKQIASLTQDTIPGQRDETITAQVNEVAQQGLAQVNAAIADHFGTIGADIATGKAHLKQAKGNIRTATAKIKNSNLSPEEQNWHLQSLWMAYLRTPDGSISEFTAEELLQ